MFAYYNGKVVDMSYLDGRVRDEKQKFSLACARVLDNAKEGYVVDGSKVYSLSPRSRKAILVSGDERNRVLAAVGLPVNPTPTKRSTEKRSKAKRSKKKRSLKRMRMALRLRGHDIMRRGRVADISQHGLKFGHAAPIPGVTYRVELSNRYEGSRVVGNAYGVARYIDGRRNTYVLQPQRSELVADAVRDALTKGKLADPEATSLAAYFRSAR